MAEVCESLRELTSGRAEWIWNASYQRPYDKAKSIIKEGTCMNFCDEIQPLYLETYTSGEGIRASQLQTRD